MKLTVEIEDSVYNVFHECFAPAGISVELFVQRLLTQVVALVVANPDAAKAIFEQGLEVPEYRHLLEQLRRPVPEEVNDGSN